MAKYRIYAMATASWLIGEYEAKDKDAAIRMAEDDPEADTWKSLCHQCSREMDLGDVYDFDAEEVG